MKAGTQEVVRRTGIFLILYLIILAVCICIKASFTREQIYFAVNGHYNPFADLFFDYYTNIGDGLFTILMVLLLALFGTYRQAFLLLSSYAVTSITAQILKRLFDAPRPKTFFADQLQRIHFVEGLNVHSVHSFPSGHSVTAFSTALVLLYFYPKRWFGVLLFVLAVLAGFSRMYLSQHFFEDVMAGSVIGVFVTMLWLSWLDRKSFLHQAGWNQSLIKRWA